MFFAMDIFPPLINAAGIPALLTELSYLTALNVFSDGGDGPPTTTTANTTTAAKPPGDMNWAAIARKYLLRRWPFACLVSGVVRRV